MTQCSKFALKEHTDLPHLPNLDIYCNLSEMIINFKITLLFPCVLIFGLSHQDWSLGGAGWGWNAPASANSPLSHQHVQILACHNPRPSPLLNCPTHIWPNVIFLNWMQLHLGRVLRAIFPFYWKLFINPISKSESCSCIKYIQYRWEAIKLTKHIPW